jgi:hypothetical protein
VREIGKEAISNQAATSRFLVESKSELKPDTPIELINPEYPYVRFKALLESKNRLI